jgi:hypothetical protein
LIERQTGGLFGAKTLGTPVLTGKKSGMEIVLFEVPFVSLEKLYAALEGAGNERGRDFVWVTAKDLENGRITYGAAGKTAPIFAARMMSGDVQNWLHGGAR